MAFRLVVMETTGKEIPPQTIFIEARPLPRQRSRNPGILTLHVGDDYIQI